MSFLSVREFPYNAETARLEGDYNAGDGVAFDVGVAVPFWRALAARLAVTRVSRDTSSETRGSFPHPFFFNTSRTGTWTSDALDLSEIGVHVSIDVKVLERERFGLSFFGGPSWLIFNQGVIENLDLVENYPYDAIDARVVTGSVKGTGTGFHVGIDGSWFFSRHVGVGGIIRYAAARRQNVCIREGEPFEIGLGGAQGSRDR